MFVSYEKYISNIIGSSSGHMLSGGNLMSNQKRFFFLNFTILNLQWSTFFHENLLLNTAILFTKQFEDVAVVAFFLEILSCSQNIFLIDNRLSHHKKRVILFCLFSIFYHTMPAWAFLKYYASLSILYSFLFRFWSKISKSDTIIIFAGNWIRGKK